MPDSSVTHIYDVAQATSVELHVGQYCDRICRLVTQYLVRVDAQASGKDARAVDSAFVVGLHGAWGCGKSTLMKMIGAELRKRRQDNLMVLEFQAWKFNQREVLWRALLSRVVAEARKRIDDLDENVQKGLTAKCDAIEEALFRDYEQTIGHAYGLKLSAVPALVESVVKLNVVESLKNIWKTVEREEVKKFHGQIAALDQFQDHFRELREALKVPWLILIDDLDRCLPESAVDIFEATKVFLDVPGVVFVLALDKQTIRSGLQVRYNEKVGERPLVDPEQYIEKVTNISFVLPTLHRDEVEDFVMHLCDQKNCDRADGVDTAADLALVRRLLGLVLKSDGPGIQPNPRRWIRLLNTAFLYDSIRKQFEACEAKQAAKAKSKASGEAIPDGDAKSGDDSEHEEKDCQFVKLLLLSYRWGGFMDAVLSSWDVMETFESAARQSERDFETYKSVCGAKYPELKMFAEDPDLFRLLHASPVVSDLGPHDLVRRLFV
jgi:KAP family P-loop domain